MLFRFELPSCFQYLIAFIFALIIASTKANLLTNNSSQDVVQLLNAKIQTLGILINDYYLCKSLLNPNVNPEFNKLIHNNDIPTYKLNCAQYIRSFESNHIEKKVHSITLTLKKLSDLVTKRLELKNQSFARHAEIETKKFHELLIPNNNNLTLLGATPMLIVPTSGIATVLNSTAGATIAITAIYLISTHIQNELNTLLRIEDWPLIYYIESNYNQIVDIFYSFDPYSGLVDKTIVPFSMIGVANDRAKNTLNGYFDISSIEEDLQGFQLNKPPGNKQQCMDLLLAYLSRQIGTNKADYSTIVQFLSKQSFSISQLFTHYSSVPFLKLAKPLACYSSCVAVGVWPGFCATI
jgi:hypothetical protein